MLKTLRSNYTNPLSVEDGKSLVHHSWGELLYHLNRLMQRGSLMENYAIRRLQEQIITQVRGGGKEKRDYAKIRSPLLNRIICSRSKL